MPLHTSIITEMVACGFSDHNGSKQGWREHLHCFCQFDVMMSGAVSMGVEKKKTYHYRRGDGIFIPALLRHSYRAEKHFCIGVYKFHVAPAYWRLLGETAFRIRLSPNTLRGATDAIIACNRRAPLCDQQAAAALTLCLIEAFNSRSPRYSSPASTGLRARLWQLLEKVESDPYRRWTVAGLAAQCHLTPDHFGRCFRQALEQTPLEYLAKVRLRAAAHELSSDAGKSIKEVADASGFASVHAFTRAFRRVMGLNPGAFRRMPSDF